MMQDLSVGLLSYLIVAAFLYWIFNRTYDPKEDLSALPSLEAPTPDDIPDLSGLFILQYEQINERVRSRENVTVVVGSLFVTTSVLLLSSAASSDKGVKEVLVLASLALYSIWMFSFSLPANMLSSRELFQLRQMERRTQYRINMHTYLWNKVKETGWYRILRRQIWVYPFFVLTTAGIVLLEA